MADVDVQAFSDPEAVAAQLRIDRRHLRVPLTPKQFKAVQKLRSDTWSLLQSREPDLVSAIEIWDDLLNSPLMTAREAPAGEPVTKGPYTGFSSAADALVAYLREHGPTKRLVAMRAVVEGGWASGHRNPVGLIRDAMNYQLRRSESPKVIVRQDDILEIAE